MNHPLGFIGKVTQLIALLQKEEVIANKEKNRWGMKITIMISSERTFHLTATSVWKRAIKLCKGI